MKLAIIQYNAGNIQSVTYALDRLGITPILTADPEEIRAADKVIFPGVGEASTAMNSLKQTGLDQLIPTLKQPLLGICLGMQVMCTYSEENDTKCMGIFDEQVKLFQPHNGDDKSATYGVEYSYRSKKSTFHDSLSEKAYAYFVHSYYVEKGSHTIATTDYVVPFSAALHKDNFYATQFHPEKSGTAGAQILKNFLETELK